MHSTAEDASYGPMTPRMKPLGAAADSPIPWTNFLSPSLFTSTIEGVKPIKVESQSTGTAGLYTHAREINPFEQSFATTASAPTGSNASGRSTDQTAIPELNRTLSSNSVTTPVTRSRKRVAEQQQQQEQQKLVSRTSSAPKKSSSSLFGHRSKRPKLRLNAATGTDSESKVGSTSTLASTSTTRSKSTSASNSDDNVDGRQNSSSSLATTVSPGSSAAGSPKDVSMESKQQQSQSQQPATTSALGQIVNAQQQHQQQSQQQSFTHFQPAPRPISFASINGNNGNSSAMAVAANAAGAPFPPPLPPSTVAGSMPSDYGYAPLQPHSTTMYPTHDHSSIASSSIFNPQHPAQFPQQHHQQPSMASRMSLSGGLPSLQPSLDLAPSANALNRVPIGASAASASPSMVPGPATVAAVAAKAAATYAAHPGLIPRKRGRKPKVPDPQAVTVDPEIEKAAALERNRIAASKSRMRKKEKVKGLEQTAADLAASNAMLQATCHALQAELMDLRALLDSRHPQGACTCAHVVGYLAREAQGGGIPTIERLSAGTLVREYGVQAGGWAPSQMEYEQEQQLQQQQQQQQLQQKQQQQQMAMASAHGASQGGWGGPGSVASYDFDELDSPASSTAGPGQHFQQHLQSHQPVAVVENEVARRNAIPIRRRAA